MKRKNWVSALTTGVLAAGLLLGAHTASAATVIFGDGGNKATGIKDLDIGGKLYDVSFTVQSFAFEVYGPFAGSFDVFSERFAALNGVAALRAVNAVSDELEAAGALSIGEAGNPFESLTFNVGYGSSSGSSGIEMVNTARGFTLDVLDRWFLGGMNQLAYNGDERTWAEFAEVAAVPVPAAVWLFGSGLFGLIGIARHKRAA